MKKSSINLASQSRFKRPQVALKLVDNKEIAPRNQAENSVFVGRQQRKSMTHEESLQLIERALSGDQKSLSLFVKQFSPVVQAKIARVLTSSVNLKNAIDIRQEVQDLTQDIFSLLFANEGKVLRGWDPSKGAGLPYFIGIIAERRTLNHLRKVGKLIASRQEGVEIDEKPASSMSEPEQKIMSHQLLTRLLAKLWPQLSEMGQHMFDYLFLQDLPVGEICAKADMKEDAVYAWRSRLRRKIRAALNDIDFANDAYFSTSTNQAESYE